MILTMKCLLISWLMTHFEPLQNLIDLIFKNYSNNKFIMLFYNAITCFKCISFWITLIVTFNIYAAIINSIIAYTYIKIIK